MTNFKAGDKIQKHDNNSSIGVRDGVLVEYHEPIRQKPMKNGVIDYDAYYALTDKEQAECLPYSTVKWEDSGKEERIISWSIHQRDTEFEREFRLAQRAAQKLIDEKLKIAMDALSEAETISTETGVPFMSNISPVSQSFTPSTVKNKFPNIEQYAVQEISGTNNDYGYDGWQHSAVC